MGAFTKIFQRLKLTADTNVSTQTTTVIAADTTNSSIAIVPNGTGALIADIPDGAATGGNARGANAVDLQLNRNAANEVASGNYSFIGGGIGNKSTNIYSSITGGEGNTTSGAWCFIGNGFSNTASTNWSTISGGQTNIASTNSHATVVGGLSNTSSGQFSISGGQLNNASGQGAVTLGTSNTASSNFSTVSGGQSNTASTNTHATVVGGQGNTASGQHSVVGGINNTASGVRAIALGSTNTASGIGASVAIGNQNTATADSAIALGRQNNSTATFASALGSFNNVSSVGSVAIGYQNTISGIGYSLGKNTSITSAESGTTLGNASLSYLYAQSSLASVAFQFVGDAQQSNLTARREAALTTAATTVLSLDGSGVTALIIPNGSNRAWNVQVNWVAVVQSITGTATGITIGDVVTSIDLLAFKKIGGVSSASAHTSTATKLMVTTPAAYAACAIAYTAGASQEMALTFTGPTFVGGGSVTMRVVAKVELTEVAF